MYGPGHAGGVAPLSGAEVPGGEAGRELYGLDPDQFTAARNALAKQLRTDGDKAEAALVAKLRRPPATAWALNRVVRERPGVVDAVLDAGADLRVATESALEGDASRLRTAQAWERRAVDNAASAAAAVLTAAGHGGGDAARQRMAGTLRAAMVDADVAAALRAGVLDDDRDASGFGLDAFSDAAAGSATRRRAPARPHRAAPRSTAGSPDGSPDGAAGTAPDAREAADRAVERAEAVAAAERATRRAAELARSATDLEQAAGAARDVATTARTEAERAMAAAAALEAAAEAAAAGAAAARAAADEADAQAAEATRAASALGGG